MTRLRSPSLLPTRKPDHDDARLTTLAALLAAPAAAASAASAAANDVAVTDVTVVDTRTGALAPHRTVVVHYGRIATVGADRPPAGVEVVRGTGKF